MFGMGMLEIMLVLAVALIVVGPEKLPGLAKTIGKAMGEFKNATRDFKRSIDVESDLQDVRDSFSDLKDIPTYDPDKEPYSDKKSPGDSDNKPGAAEQDGAPDGCNDVADDPGSEHKSATGADPNG